MFFGFSGARRLDNIHFLKTADKAALLQLAPQQLARLRTRSTAVFTMVE
jgi:hypothetical protein